MFTPPQLFITHYRIYLTSPTLIFIQNIKLSVTKTAPESLIDGSEEITPSQANTAKQTAVAVTKLVRKNFIETVIPDIISLKIQVWTVGYGHFENSV